MSLDTLADQIVDAAARGLTPVLVTPDYLSFRPAFFRELAMLVSTRADVPVRFDRVRSAVGMMAMIGDLPAKLHAGRSTRAMGRFGSLRLTAIVGRPQTDLVVIGWSNAGETMPAWATPIELAERPFPNHARTLAPVVPG